MSVNGKGSCSTCHLQKYVFGDQKTVAIGVTGEKHSRRAMSLANVAYFTAFNWANPTVKNLEQQARTPLFGQHPVELSLPEAGRSVLENRRLGPALPRTVARGIPRRSGTVHFWPPDPSHRFFRADMPTWFKFLRIEADLAMTFSDLARNHTKPVDSTRSLGRARKALEEIRRGLMRPGLGTDEMAFLEQRCKEIEAKLKSFRRATQD
jgi:hypothetical protein